MRLLALVLVLLSLSAAAAQAHDSPASDWLAAQDVFVPFDVKAADANRRELTETVAAAWRQQFPVKVAVIGSAHDLGEAASLWRKPRAFARFLGTDLTYRQRLLTVMPNGLGFYWHGHSAARAYSALDAITIGAGPNGLVDAAREAIRRLAAESGVTIAAAKPPADHTSRDRLIIIVAAVVLIALAGLGRAALRRRG